MRKIFPIFLLGYLFCFCSTPEPREIRVVELSGSPYNRGLIHGQILMEEVHAILNQFEAHVEQMHELQIDSVKTEYLAKIRYQNAIQQWNPALLDEVRGIADGADVDFETLFLFQMGEEFLTYLNETQPKRCTAIGVSHTDDAPCIVAQNMDPPYFLHGFPTLLHIEYDSLDLESYVLTAPGLLALNGMNSKGIGITANGLSGLNPDLKGLPVAFVIRTTLEQTSIKDAVSFIKSVNHAKAQNYIVGGPEEAVSLECDGRKIHSFVSEKNSKVTYHTNHYLARPHVSNYDYCSRLETMKEALEKVDYQIGFKEIQKILSSTKWNAGRPISHPFCYGSTIMVLGSPPELYLAPGQPDLYDYVRFGFED
ncbi:hypothetical protein HQ585_05880 [candidate division KSB1 bacterium]|nr:hypothetical protein [candidate division KSB1 bacterium]